MDGLWFRVLLLRDLFLITIGDKKAEEYKEQKPKANFEASY
jgi:hypothetical protein